MFLLIYGRLLSEVTEKTHAVEIRLAFGCNKHEAVLPVLRGAMKAALVTTILAEYIYFDRIDDDDDDDDYVNILC